MSEGNDKETAQKILNVLGDKLNALLGSRPGGDVVLQLAKSVGFVKGRQGRNGGTFSQEAGLAFLAAAEADSGLFAETCETDCGCETKAAG